MTIDEAIQYAENLGTEEENKIDYDKDSPHTIIRRKNTVKDYRWLAKWLRELKEAKRLLKAAIEDLNATAAEVYNGGVICECCKWESQIGECSCPDNGGCDTDYQWRYADEALKLIGDEPNV